ncbi:RNA polymerase sigma-70 factor [Chitinophaga sp. SYP-B3965]|uniref:RNA polymerase sigma factor n=1 Tax=Chitinophaga sp. SYP-B3965 TaxID=2663120 RepID=UPI001299C557|nr:RNA polymerase sigma-70 factor [Chitinophaga sp. SYP-B3965]MRG44858.1 RNA polymerase sigma-70 factor [Chitinophaga sp. SYP-B3965]
MEQNYKILSEVDLFALFLESDQQAFTECYNRYSPLIYSYARRILRDACQTDDVLQDVFIILWEKRSRLEIESDLINYLFGITRHRVLHELRKSKKLQNFIDTLEKKMALYESSPEEYIINKERTKIVETEINRLPERMKTIVNLSRSGDYSYREIAEEFNVSPGAIKDQVYHATKKLRLKLVKHFFSLF